METKDLLLPLIAALWGCTTLVFSATIELNKIRDRVILGQDAGQPIPPEHQKHIMHNDWKPMTACIIFVCLSFSALAASSPWLLTQRTLEASLIAGGVAVFSAFMGLIWIPAARADWRAMNTAYEHHLADSRGT